MLNPNILEDEVIAQRVESLCAIHNAVREARDEFCQSYAQDGVRGLPRARMQLRGILKEHGVDASHANQFIAYAEAQAKQHETQLGRS